jgi:hypothetical protein
MAYIRRNMYEEYYEITNTYLKLHVQFVGTNTVYL